jgi:hypothetical protein
MRVYFLTLRADNLPETGKRQYENKGDVRASRREKQKRKFVPSFFRQAKCTAHFGCIAASKRLKF